MYRHRPDVVSFFFGLLFTAIGALSLSGVSVGSQLQLLLPVLGAALGLAVVASLITGSPRAARTPVAPAPLALEPPPSQQPNDPFFDSPIDPDLLEEAYREVFGDDDPAANMPTASRIDTSPDTDTGDAQTS